MYGDGYNIDEAFERLEVKVTIPNLFIKSVDKEGLLVIGFSDEFRVVKDLALFSK